MMEELLQHSGKLVTVTYQTTSSIQPEHITGVLVGVDNFHDIKVATGLPYGHGGLSPLVTIPFIGDTKMIRTITYARKTLYTNPDNFPECGGPISTDVLYGLAVRSFGIAIADQLKSEDFTYARMLRAEDKNPPEQAHFR